MFASNPSKVTSYHRRNMSASTIFVSHLAIADFLILLHLPITIGRHDKSSLFTNNYIQINALISVTSLYQESFVSSKAVSRLSSCTLQFFYYAFLLLIGTYLSFGMVSTKATRGKSTMSSQVICQLCKI